MMMRFVICSLLLYSSVYHRGSHYESSRVEAAGRSSGECGTEPPVNPFYLFIYLCISSMICRCCAEMVLRTQLRTRLRTIISGGYCGTVCYRTIKLSRYMSERGRN